MMFRNSFVQLVEVLDVLRVVRFALMRGYLVFFTVYNGWVILATLS